MGLVKHIKYSHAAPRFGHTYLSHDVKAIIIKRSALPLNLTKIRKHWFKTWVEGAPGERHNQCIAHYFMSVSNNNTRAKPVKILQQFQVHFVHRVRVGSLNDDGNVPEPFVPYDPAKGRLPYLALAEMIVPVYAACERFLCIVRMDHLQAASEIRRALRRPSRKHPAV